MIGELEQLTDSGREAETVPSVRAAVNFRTEAKNNSECRDASADGNLGERNRYRRDKIYKTEYGRTR